MKILFIAPLPPPITGQAYISKILLDELKKYYKVEVVNFNKGSLKQGLNSFKRIFEVIKILYEIEKKQRKVDLIYFTISQTLLGNIKDIFTYLICFRKLSKMIIHLHGGGIKRLIFDRYPILYQLNKFFIRRLGGVIVLGDSLKSIFQEMTSENKIYIIPNFANDDLFLKEEEIKEKFNNIYPLRVLYLSNFLPGKGYKELLEAYIILLDELKDKISIDFAGEFESEYDKYIFLEKIKNFKNIMYYGVVNEEKKKELFKKAHIFCLPTYYYYYEGQPVSILEAYASGCVVITTNHGGICDIFKDKENGFLVEKKSIYSIKEIFEEIIYKKDLLLNIALNNNKYAENNFKKNKFVENMNRTFLEIIHNSK